MVTDASAHLDDLASFVTSSPTSFHAAEAIAERLTAAGYRRLLETETFSGAAGNYFVVRGGGLVAWRQPADARPGMGLRIVGTHTDSPALKLKPGPDAVTAGWAQARVEIYGGMLLNSWLDREFGFAGLLVDVDGGQHLVRTGPVARVPQLAIHLDRAVNEGLKLDRQAHLQPVIGLETGGLLELLCELAGINVSQLAGHDIYSYDVNPPQRFGLRDEFFASSRLDNLSSTHAALAAFEALEESEDVPVFVAFDHEEVGSSTTSGAAGPLLENVVLRMAAKLGLDFDETRALLACSSCISADSGHAVHPNYPQYHDPVVQPKLNQGPLLKLNANQRYASDAVGAALWHRACQDAGVPTQPFVSNNAMPCGSTIGPITATRLGITTVDVGIGLLSMHSAREMCGAQDPHLLSRALRAYWEGS